MGKDYSRGPRRCRKCGVVWSKTAWILLSPGPPASWAKPHHTALRQLQGWLKLLASTPRAAHSLCCLQATARPNSPTTDISWQTRELIPALQEAQVLGLRLPSCNSEVFTPLKPLKLHYLVYWHALLSPAQDKTTPPHP